VEVGAVRYAFEPTGLDHVEFLIAPNPGEEPKPLAKTASGGETSRLMLAMKTALSGIDPVPTLFFDEIDAGIGGRTGSVVGYKLWTLAQDHQVFCVTHLAQMACYGERHFQVVKGLLDGRTVSLARALPPEERVEELAVMLGGGATEATRRSAEELLAAVAELKTER
jgi:DNA repair protein RecN (Recombination protein N)